MKKIFAVFLSVVLLASIVPFSVIAKELNKIDFYMSATLEGGHLTYDASHGRAKTVKNYYGAFPMTGRFYDQLSDTQKEVYNALISSDITAEQVEVTFSTPVLVETSDSNWTPVSDVIFAAYYAVIRDHPERFWYYSAGWGSNNAWYQNDKIAVGGATINIGFHPSYSASTIESVYSQLMEAVNSFKPVGRTRYETVRSIHDYLVTKATYDPNYDNSNAAPYGHQPTGCLLSPNLCVCEGYAEAFKLFADREGIPNMLVSSPGHIWNVVLMEDNKWYAVDCTWDDPMTGNTSYSVLQYSYFLVGSTTAIDSSGTQFSQEESHIEENVYTDSNGNSLLNPPLNSISYAPFYPQETWRTNGVQGNDHPGGSILQGNKLVFLAPGCSVKNCFILNSSTGSISASGDKTGSSLIFTTTSGVASTYTVIMYGDVNKDALVNSTDMNYITDISVGKKKFSSNSPETYAGDLNGDGVVDAFDLAILDIYQSGNYSFY
ncbi:MAG: hypothetical protein E7515_01485 [Ruminococcaceae bacterium]|jgi:hypothetical protein|nr:hypothetical protein [Oscillospiraceae bacterium]